jgi:mRNA-degrading endonuclease RelE of RelBE toxin-antitoxin system
MRVSLLESKPFPFRSTLYWMTGMGTDVRLENPCVMEKDFCINCHSHFKTIRPLIRTIAISRHFIRDLRGQEEVDSIVSNVLDCSGLDFSELHKFEEDIDGDLIFRAKKGGTHIVYCVDKKMRIIFLRAFKNYSEYGNFLRNKKEIKKMIARVS